MRRILIRNNRENFAAKRQDKYVTNLSHGIFLRTAPVSVIRGLAQIIPWRMLLHGGQQWTKMPR